MSRYRIKIYSLILSLVLLKIFSIDFNLTNIPELQFYNNQTIKLLIPPKRCNFLEHKTLYLFSEFRNNSNDLMKKYKIIEYKNKGNSLVTYYIDDNEYNQYKNLLFSQGIINSVSIFGDHNFYFSFKAIDLIKYNKSLIELNNFKKFHLFINYEVFTKDSLYINYLEMKNKFENDYNFMPLTYNYPIDKDIIEKKFKNYTLDMNNLWLIKPKNNCGGNGIKFLKSLKKIKDDEFLITKYITNLDLINNKKYDLRLYVLITGLKPLRIYFYREGLVRIAAKNYTLEENSIHNRFVYLTNIGVNSQSKDFIVPNLTNIENANVWNLETYSNHLRKINIDYIKIRNKIKDIIIKSMISIYKNLTIEQSKNNLNDINYYDVLGYDFIIQDNYDPILLEINKNPRKKYANDLDKIIKTNLIVDTLNLVGISIFSKNIIYNRIFKSKKLNSDDYVNNALCELERPLGDYELIFPLKTNINTYKKYFENINNKENIIFWKKIKKGY